MILPTFSSFEIMLIVSEKVNNLSTQKKNQGFFLMIILNIGT